MCTSGPSGGWTRSGSSVRSPGKRSRRPCGRGRAERHGKVHPVRDGRGRRRHGRALQSPPTGRSACVPSPPSGCARPLGARMHSSSACRRNPSRIRGTAGTAGTSTSTSTRALICALFQYLSAGISAAGGKALDCIDLPGGGGQRASRLIGHLPPWVQAPMSPLFLSWLTCKSG